MNTIQYNIRVVKKFRVFRHFSDSRVFDLAIHFQVVTLLTISHELYTKMFSDQNFQVSSCV